MTTTTFRKKLTARRQARAAKKNLVRELATYRTDHEVTDLLATFEDQDGPEVDAMRTILTRQLDHATTSSPFQGPQHTEGALV